jgi:hypothetical protein
MKRSAFSPVARLFRATRNWLKNTWLGRLSIVDWVRRLCRPRGRLAAWEKSGKPRRVQLALESVERRETPNDIFGLLGTPLLGSGLSLLGGPLLTPATVLISGWSAAAAPLPSTHVSASDGLRAPGLSGAPAPPTALVTQGGGPAAPPADRSPALPALTYSGVPRGWSTDPFANQFANPLGGDWLDAVGASLGAGAPATPATNQAGASAAGPAAAAADSTNPAPPTASAAQTDASGAVGVDPFLLTSGASAPAGNTAAPRSSSGSSPTVTTSAQPRAAGAGTVLTNPSPWPVSALQTFGRGQMAFEPNLGQTNPQVQFLAHGPGFQTFLTASGAVLSLAEPGQGTGPAMREALQISFAGGDPAAKIEATDQLLSRSNYFVGADASKWLQNVPNYGAVTYHSVYPGIDVQFHGDSQRELEYDFVVAPGADLSRVRVKWQGAQSVTTDGQGDLLIVTGSGRTLTQRPPVLFQTSAGVTTTVSGAYVLNADGTVGFAAQGYDRTRELVVDPSLVYSSYLGGSGDDKAYAVAVFQDGSAYVTGSTTSNDFPTGSALHGSYAGSTDVFVTKMNPSGTGIAFSTFLGGSMIDVGYGVALDPSGNAVVVGSTQSSNFPTTAGAYQTSNPYAIGTAFVAKLSATGNALLYSTFLGPAGGEAKAVAVDPAGDAFVTGDFAPAGSSFPTTSGAFQTSAGGGADAFVTKLNPTGTALAYSADLGGSGGDYGTGIALDAAGDAYVAGYTTGNFPLANAYQSSIGSATYAAFLTKVNPSGSSKLFSTYFSGSSGDNRSYGVAVDKNGDGSAYFTGYTTATDFPTTAGAYQTSNPAGGFKSAFVAKLGSTGSLGYSSYLGGPSGDSQGNAVAFDGHGQCAPSHNAFRFFS